MIDNEFILIVLISLLLHMFLMHLSLNKRIKNLEERNKNLDSGLSHLSDFSKDLLNKLK